MVTTDYTNGVVDTPVPVAADPVNHARNITPQTEPMVKPRTAELDKAAAFMSTKPGGAQQTGQRDMQQTERRVSSHLQRKNTTSNSNKVALVSVAAASAARNKTGRDHHKRRGKTTATPTKRKKTNTPSIPAVTPASTKQQKKTKAIQAPLAPVASIIKCKYGCSHGGLIELLQMSPGDTRHYLEHGKYLHKKDCLDCKTNIGELFMAAKTKSKFLLYYCQVDYNGAELDDDSDELKAVACACVLCVPCYFGREKKKVKHRALAAGPPDENEQPDSARKIQYQHKVHILALFITIGKNTVVQNRSIVVKHWNSK